MATINLNLNERIIVEGADVIDSTAEDNSVRITPSANKSASTSAGGALNINNTNSTGAGMVIYTNMGTAAAGRAFVVRVDNTGNPQQGMFLQYKGTNHGLAIDHQGSGAASLALTVTSTNTADTTAGFTGSQTGRAVLKVTHNYPGTSDANAAAITVNLAGSATAAQGLFMDAPDGTGTSGKLLNIRNVGSEKLVLTGAGDLQLNGVSMRSFYHRERSGVSVVSLANGTFVDVPWLTDVSEGSDIAYVSSTEVEIQADGVYRLTGNCGFAAASGGSRIVSFILDSVNAIASQRTLSVSGSYSTNLTITRVMSLSNGDNLKMVLYQDSGSTINSIDHMSFTVERIG